MTWGHEDMRTGDVARCVATPWPKCRRQIQVIGLSCHVVQNMLLLSGWFKRKPCLALLAYMDWSVRKTWWRTPCAAHGFVMVSSWFLGVMRLRVGGDEGDLKLRVRCVTCDVVSWHTTAIKPRVVNSCSLGTPFDAFQRSHVNLTS